MPEAQRSDDYIEPVGVGSMMPAPTPADAFGLQPLAPAPAASPGPQDQVIPTQGAVAQPLRLVANQTYGGNDQESNAYATALERGFKGTIQDFKASGGQSPTISDAPPSHPEIKPQGAPQGSPGFVDPSNPMGLPPEAADVIGVIRASEGTAKKQGYTLFGGQDFVPGYEHPAKEGWRGSVTQYGPTHAAGPGQMQPGTWDDEKKRAKAQDIDLDFGKGAHQDWAIWDRASRLYKDATGKDLAADVKAGKADYSVLGGEWQGLLKGTGSTTLRGRMVGMSPGLQEMARSIERNADDLRDKYHGDVSELMREANAAAPGSKERDDAIHRLRAREDKYLSEYEAVAKNPPVMKPVDAMANFGSIGTIIGLLGGLFARNHMTAALSASGAAMKAVNENNYEAFQRSYKAWEQQSTTALNMVKLHNEQIRELIDDRRMATDEKNTKLRFAFEGLGMNRQADMMAQGAHGKVFAEMVNLEKMTQTASQMQLQTKLGVRDVEFARLNAEGDPEAWTKANRLAGIIPQGSQETPAKQQAAEISREIKRLDDKFAAENPGATADQKAEAHHKNDLASRSEMALATARSPTGQLSEESVKLLAKQYEMGDMGVITSLPRGGPGRIQVENQIAADMKNMPEAAGQIILNRMRMAEAKSAATTAGRITMQTEMYAQEAVGAGHQVIETSKLFPRTNFPTVNAALAAFEQGTGDPNIVRFGAALNSFINVYGKLSNPTGIGIHDADKERITKIIDRSLSQGQIDAGVEQIITEGKIVSQAAKDAQIAVLAGITPRDPNAPPQTSGEPGKNPAPAAPGDELRHVKEAISAGAPRDAARAEFIKRGGDPAAFDREVPR